MKEDFWNASVAGEGIDERESSTFEEVKLSLYRTFGKIVEFKLVFVMLGQCQERMD